MRISSGEQIFFFRNDSILRFEEAAGQSLIHFVDGKNLKISESIQSLENQLTDSGFIRIHERHIVNVNCITRISNSKEDFVELSNGEVLPINGKQKEIILELITTHLEKNEV